jgi:hypothetical protein
VKDLTAVDVHGETRRAWLDQQARDSQSDFENSVIWRGVFIAAFIVTVINIPASPPPMQAPASVRATV